MRREEEILSRFCKRVVALDMDVFGLRKQAQDAEPEGKIKWRSLENGQPFPIKNGETIKEAAENFIKEKKKQRISSAKTSRKQIASVFKKIPFKSGTRNLDIGGGKWDLGTDYMKSKGVESLVYDPYNRDKEHNQNAISTLKNGKKFDTATIANVLNVIEEPEYREAVIKQAASAISDDGVAYFQIYEGSGNGKGGETSDGWQNNRKTADYEQEIRKHFGDVKRIHGNILMATKPQKTGKVEWFLEKDGEASETI